MHAILAATSRSDATLAALLLARGLAAAGPTLLVRVAPPGAAPLPNPYAPADDLVVAQLVAEDVDAAEAAFALPAVANGRGPAIVLDLPAASARDERVLALGDKAFLAVGPNALDEEAAAATLVEAGRGGRVPFTALGCSRPGGARSATLFAQRMAWAVATAGGVPGPVADAVAPALGRGDQEALLTGPRLGRVDRLARAFAAALTVAPAVPGLDDDIPDFGDAESFPDTLRRLADDLDDVEEDRGPTRADLDGAPVLDDWTYEDRPRRVLAGRVRNHPLIPDGRRIVTSDLYACDGRNWGRTASRYYALGRRAR